MPPKLEVPRGLFYCSNCGHQGIFRWIYTLVQVAYLLGVTVGVVKMAIKKGYMEFRWHLGEGRTDKVVTLPQFIKYIEERYPTPEALRSTNFNITMKAIAKELNWKEEKMRKQMASQRVTLAKKRARAELEQRRKDGRDEVG